MSVISEGVSNAPGRFGFRTAGVRRAAPAAGKLLLGVSLALAACFLVRGLLSREGAAGRLQAMIQAGAGGYSDAQLTAIMADAGPGALRLAAEHDPDAAPKAWGRPAGWERLEVTSPPKLGFVHLSMADAQRINGAIPDTDVDNPPTEPFVLRAKAPERDAAVKCLTAAIYYEAALEPRAGQEAVAQVVLNRMRHPGYPKSVCGVVFQGSNRPGCQFSFACDGSMARPPAAWAWRNAHDVAVHALDGHVMREVGTATHYHTAWVMASWTPTLIKVRQIGAHIFFRPLGPEGQPEAFKARYLGGEAATSKVDLIGTAQAATAAPLVLTRASVAGSVLAPTSVVRDGRVVALPPSTIFLGRVHAVIDPTAAQPAAMAPMHAMIALRADAAKQALASAQGPPAAASAVRPPVPSAPRPATPAPVKPPAPTTMNGFELAPVATAPQG